MSECVSVVGELRKKNRRVLILFVRLTLQLVSITFAHTGTTMNTLDGWVIKQKALSDDEELGVYEAKRPRLISPAASDASTSEETVRAPVPSSSTGGSAKKRTARPPRKSAQPSCPG